MSPVSSPFYATAYFVYGLTIGAEINFPDGKNTKAQQGGSGSSPLVLIRYKDKPGAACTEGVVGFLNNYLIFECRARNGDEIQAHNRLNKNADLMWPLQNMCEFFRG